MTEESGKAYQETHLLPEKEATVPEVPADDPVNHPAHYTDGIEVIDYIESKNFCYHIGNAVKYLSRAGKKDPSKEIEDLQKAVWYINRRIRQLEEAGK